MFDLPPLRFEVTEPLVLAAQRACGKIGLGEFPPGMSAPVQYDSAAMAAAIHLTHYPMMPGQCTAALRGDFFGLPMAEAMVLTCVFEVPGPTWVGGMIDLPVTACHKVNERGSPLPMPRIAIWRFATDQNVHFTHSRTSRSHGQGYSR